VGHLDPEFIALMEHTKGLLRSVFQTQNTLTLPISGTGSAGMEACVVNFVEPGDRVVVAVCGLFGQRLAEVARRCGATVTTVEAPWGEPVPPEALANAVMTVRPKLLAVVHAETSTGVLQPVAPLAAATRESGALLLVDTVTSLGGVEVDVDRWAIDICYSGTQKCLSCPPGLAPVTVSDRALEALHQRRTPVHSWYLDLGMIEQYWGQDRVYHHTAPVSMAYALYEALRLVDEEGLSQRWARHQTNHERLVRGLEALGLSLPVAAPWRLPSLNAVSIPAGVDDLALRRTLLRDWNLEIGGGLGPLKGRIWRVGLMGHGATRDNVVLLLTALGKSLKAQGIDVHPGAAVEAALAV
jgi:alanine-glyoxylate transaminase/serine-glyoxylate transaminase/serine-pyruvate transaminase